jgi:nitrite reductase/ring-hydroxylating ferredoxin subunit
MSEHASRREFLLTSACAGAGVCAGLSAGCGGQEQGGSSPNDPIGDPSFYPTSPRQPMGPMDNDMPVCGSTSGLLAGPQASTLDINTAVQVQSRIFICRNSNGTYALDLTCPHAGCQPALNPGQQIWICPCHGSQFQIDGTYILGPAGRSLRRFYVCKGSDGRLYIDTNRPA